MNIKKVAECAPAALMALDALISLVDEERAGFAVMARNNLRAALDERVWEPVHVSAQPINPMAAKIGEVQL